MTLSCGRFAILCSPAGACHFLQPKQPLRVLFTAALPLAIQNLYLIMESMCSVRECLWKFDGRNGQHDVKPAEFWGALRPASRVPFQAVCQHIVDRPSTEDRACRFYATSLL